MVSAKGIPLTKEGLRGTQATHLQCSAICHVRLGSWEILTCDALIDLLQYANQCFNARHSFSKKTEVGFKNSINVRCSQCDNFSRTFFIDFFCHRKQFCSCASQNFARRHQGLGQAKLCHLRRYEQLRKYRWEPAVKIYHVAFSFLLQNLNIDYSKVPRSMEEVFDR